MRAYILRRLLLMIPTIFLVTMIAFLTVRFIPTSVIDLMVSEMAYQAGIGMELTAASIRHQLGMDIPVWLQYVRWLGNAVQGDLGNSLWTNRSITEELLNRLPVSFELGLFAILTGMTIALPIGIYSAIRQDTAGDYFGRTIAILAISLPPFWIATILIIYPSIWWGWMPPVQYIPFVQNPIGNIGQFMLPAIIMGLGLSGTAMRMTRTMMLEVLRQDYIRTAWSKGLSEWTIVSRHAMKNALIPVVTVVGQQITIMIGGTVIMESIFSLPGMGLYLIQALNTRDYPIISGINVATAFFVVFLNLGVDLTYGWFDPRIQYE